MPARKKREEQINLLPQKGFQASTAGRLLAWILSTFRVIVIVTEIIVMMAFLSRFYFDAQNSDLNEDIEHKQAVLSASHQFELRFKDVQRRLGIFSSLTRVQTPYSQTFLTIKDAIPEDVILTNINGTPETIKITGVTPNERSIQQLIVNLTANNKFSDVGLMKASTSLEELSLLEFIIEVKVNKELTTNLN